MNIENKKEYIKGLTMGLLIQSFQSMNDKIDKAIESGALDIDEWDPVNNRMIIPEIIATAILEDESTQYSCKNSSWEKQIKKEVKNLRLFI